MITTIAAGEPAANEKKDNLNMKKMEFGNPRGAGRYGYIRSSEDCDALITNEDAQYDTNSKRWFEHIHCGYACGRDGIASQEWDDLYLDEYYKERPEANFREAYYDFQYGFTRKTISEGMFILKERLGGRHRTFDFDVSRITMAEFEAYISAIEEWHRTGELNIGPYKGVPHYDRWYKN